MNKRINNLLIVSLVTVVLLFGLALTAKAVNLQDAFNGQLSTVGTRSGFNISQTNVEPIIGTVISVVLSFLGVIFLLLMVYGGYMWMTAGGSEEKVKKAKLLIQSAVLGLIVVVGAYAITVFVMGRLAGDLIPGNDSGSGTSGGVYDPSASTGGCCIETVLKPPATNPIRTCTYSGNEALCNPVSLPSTTRIYIGGKECSDSECQTNTDNVSGCCVTYLENDPIPSCVRMFGGANCKMGSGKTKATFYPNTECNPSLGCAVGL